MKIDINTKEGKGQFRRVLRKINKAGVNMRRAHRGMYMDEYCDRRRFKKWKNVSRYWNSIVIYSK